MITTIIITCITTITTIIIIIIIRALVYVMHALRYPTLYALRNGIRRHMHHGTGQLIPGTRWTTL